ncbi:sulfite exporter TauE/SafE family protein [Desulfonatronum parangueonense]
MIFPYAIVFFAALVLTMIGLGGGLIFAPSFLLLGMPQTEAVSASLLLNGLAALSATFVYMRNGLVDIPVSVPLIGGSVLAAPLGALLTHHLSAHFIFAAMAVILFLAALRMLFVGKVTPQRNEMSVLRKVFLGVLIGILIGFLAGLLGIGGGIFVVPLLIYVLKIDTKIAAASSAFIVCFSSFAGFLAHSSLASPDWTFILTASLLAIAGGQIGSRIMIQKLQSRSIRILFGLVLLVLSANLLHQVIMG